MSRITHFHELDSISYLSFSPLEKYDFLFHGFLLKKNPAKNLKGFLNKLRFNNLTLVIPKQVHSKKILALKNKNDYRKLKNNEYDGVLTDVPGMVLTVRVADCLPIFMVDPRLKIVGLIHAGWKGTLMGIVREGVERVKSSFGSNPENLVFVLGPGIGKCCYEISDSLAILFPGDCLVRDKNKIRLDLVKANLKQLLRSGVKREKIFLSNLCTFCKEELFYSFRRDKNKRKKMTAIIGIK
jgi:YfiH family protein